MLQQKKLLIQSQQCPDVYMILSCITRQRMSLINMKKELVDNGILPTATQSFPNYHMQNGVIDVRSLFKEYPSELKSLTCYLLEDCQAIFEFYKRLYDCFNQTLFEPVFMRN